MIKKFTRRSFLLGCGTLAAASLIGCDNTQESSGAQTEAGAMTYRINPKNGDKISLLGYGCMRWPSEDGRSAQKANAKIDQEQVNRLVDYAIEHGVNYFDTSPLYCKGKSEEATGIALSRHERSKYFIATKLSNNNPPNWPLDKGIAMYNNSFKLLRTPYIDYLLLHGVGMHAKDNNREYNGMETLEQRYLKNGLLDFLLRERDKGAIRNLGFSYHGDVEVFDYLLSLQEKYHWDFVQIQLNYVDWRHAKEVNTRNTNGEYLYNELVRRSIPAVIMEPLLGGRLAKMPRNALEQMKRARPNDTAAAWAFRYAGTPPGVLTVLSGMTFMEHLQENLRSFSPLQSCDEGELKLLGDIAEDYVAKPYIPCTSCQYCMPCKYGINIPAIFTHYNRCVSEGNYNIEATDPKYNEARKAFLVSYGRAVQQSRQADHCTGCGQCAPHCPQRIAIPSELRRIDQYVEKIRRNQA